VFQVPTHFPPFQPAANETLARRYAPAVAEPDGITDGDLLPVLSPRVEPDPAHCFDAVLGIRLVICAVRLEVGERPEEYAMVAWHPMEPRLFPEPDNRYVTDRLLRFQQIAHYAFGTIGENIMEPLVTIVSPRHRTVWLYARDEI